MESEYDTPAWQDKGRPVTERVAALRSRMSLAEKLAQLHGVWVGVDPDGGDVAPHQHELADPALDFTTLIRHGLGQLTRPFGTAAVEPADGAKALARMQTDIVTSNRFGIPALVHEECLTGFMTWQATIYPTPLAWGASFDPDLVQQMAAQVGATMRQVGVHQGLSPVLDLTWDPRWGRTEETMGEDPYLVATLGTAYVRGLQSAGVIATCKHFVGYSASLGGRNLGPVAVGPRMLADVLLLPFEMAIRDGGAGSVMSAYPEIDGVPVAGDPTMLTELLRQRWGFAGTVVADYFGISFLELLHGVAGSPGEAGGLALTAGVDVELPTVRCYGEPLLDLIRAGLVDEALVDRAVTRVLTQKCELGLLDPDWAPVPEALREPGGDVDLDPPAGRRLAAAVAEQSIILLANQGGLPLPGPARIAVVGPVADDPRAMFGCYAFPNHVGRAQAAGPGREAPPGLAAAPGSAVPTVLAALRDELPAAEFAYQPGCRVTDPDPAGFTAAVRIATTAQICVAVLGDHSGLFGQGSSGEGCDAEDLKLPGVQQELLEQLLDTGTPVVLVLLTGRPYALGGLAERCAAVVQAFFPGQAGGPAVAGVLSGRINPSGRLPVSLPRSPRAAQTSYLAPMLGQRTTLSSVDPCPLYPFGHGLSYTSFAWEEPLIDGRSPAAGPARIGTDGEVTVSIRIRNTGDRDGAEVVQLYLHDPVAQVTRPVARLIGYVKVPLAAGEARRVSLRVPADLAGFTGRHGQRVVEPGALELRLAASSEDVRATAALTLVGPERVLDHQRRLAPEVTVE